MYFLRLASLTMLLFSIFPEIEIYSGDSRDTQREAHDCSWSVIMQLFLRLVWDTRERRLDLVGTKDAHSPLSEDAGKIPLFTCGELYSVRFSVTSCDW